MNRKHKKSIGETLDLVILACAIFSFVFTIGFYISERVKDGEVTEVTELIMSEGEAGQITHDDLETKVWQAETQKPKHYELTEAERTLIEQVVAAECRGEPFRGQVAVAQCILNACMKDNIRPAQAISKYGYTADRATPTASVKEAVWAVFDNGEGVTDEPILYYYAPKRTSSEWHESQIFVIEIANHRFFKEA